MGKLALVFPGQGAQRPGMGEKLYEASPTARALMDKAERRLPGLLELCFRGPMEQLTRTDLAQPALFTMEMALAAVLDEMGVTPDAVAGFSLGEWSAICYACMLPFETALPLVIHRGKLMQQVADSRPGGMAAVLRWSAQEVQALCAQHPDVVPVNYNAPGQTVVAGPLDALAAFEEDLKAKGGRSMRLQVAGAFHSPLMMRASDQLRLALQEVEIAEPRLPVIGNTQAKPYERAEAASILSLQLAEPVRWVDSLHYLAGQGFDRFLELGPGKVLSGLIEKTLPGVTVAQAEDPEGLEKALKALGEKQ